MSRHPKREEEKKEGKGERKKRRGRVREKKRRKRVESKIKLRYDWVLVNDIEEGSQFIHLVEVACESACQVESEAINVHLCDPVTETVHN